MRFLLDVHIAVSIGRALMAQGHDVLRASDEHAIWSDDALMALARRQGRVLVTEDRDFSDLVFRQCVAPPFAILYLRLGPAEQLDLVDRLLLVLANTQIESHMVVVQRSGVRLRPFPKKSNDNG